MSRREGLSTLTENLAAHPYLWALGACLCFEPLLVLGASNATIYALWLETFVVLGAAAVYGMYTYESSNLVTSRFFIFCLSAAFCTFLVMRLFLQSQASNGKFSGVGAILLICAIILIAAFQMRGHVRLKGHETQIICLTIIALGFFLKLFYILVTSVYTRQNDIGSFEGMDDGHAGYIEYILLNRQLPDFDVRTRWQFYHPPLHHALSAIWLYINESVLSVSRDAAIESLQTLTLFYSTCIVVSTYRILRYFKLKGVALYAPLIVVSFHPTFILLAGSVNNDVLSIAFAVGAILCTLEWYAEQTTWGIIKIALCIGLGMMTKLSAAIVAPSVALVLVVVLIRKRKTDARRLIVQYICFASISIPLGLWFAVRNYVKWGVPLNFVPWLGENSAQYVGQLSFGSRITDFSTQQFASPFMQWAPSPYENGYPEYNPLIGLLKSALFGETRSIDENSVLIGPHANTITLVFFWLNVGIAGFALLTMIVMCFAKHSPRRTEILFLASLYVVMIASYYKMTADYPFTCTENFRYVTPTAIVGTVFIGLFLKEKLSRRTKMNRAVTAIVGASAFLFGVLSSCIYLSI